MADKSIVLVTGGNTGIGYETVKALYGSPQEHIILMGTRSPDKANEAIYQLQIEISGSKSKVVPLQIDIEDDVSIEGAFNKVENTYGRVDSLVNNAGAAFDLIMQSKPGPIGIREAWNRDYSVNVTSTQVFTNHFAPLLLQSSNPRLLFITLRGPAPKGWPKPAAPSMIAYRSSKTALNMLMLDWVRLLKPDGVKVFGISPGFLVTNLGGVGPHLLNSLGAGDASVVGIFIKDVLEGKRDEDAGKIIDKNGVQSW
ncbi:hypothetical protein BKA66DRAFT_512964 [Pyrenochaeta sp. MPI-SDFR-AT-0127]|nr:hypothetical protein BKA66DRAFT_512964 [Pyrenochaeta sp. MPI-SDFR-AT-0127]